MQIVKFTKEYLKEVADLEKICFPTRPWSEGMFLAELENELCSYFLAKIDDKVIGYVGMWCVAGEGQITNIATHPGFRRRGLGREVVSALAEYARANGIASIFLEVRESNTAARALYTACGYREIGRRRRFYRNPAEDAVLMECKIV